MSFFDPKWTLDGKPFGPERFKEIVRERYLISKHLNTSYDGTADISPLERNYLLQLITDDLKKKQEITEKMRQHNQ